MIEWKTFDVGDHRISCPTCGRGKRDKTAGLTINLDWSGVVHCFRCGHVENYRPDAGAQIIRQALIKPAAAQSEKRTSLSAWGQEFWSKCVPLSGVALEYLEYRQCVIPPVDGDLRWHPAVKHGMTRYVGPALVGLITDIHTGNPLSLHRTWITPTGKASHLGAQARMLLGNHSTLNGVIRLWPDDMVTYGLAIGEGIETCLSLAHGYTPVWATVDAGHLAKFPVLDGIETLLIARDRDPAGEKASKECADRWVAAGKRVVITRQEANDINDVIVEAA
jgi:putative DNA primase/helicase